MIVNFIQALLAFILVLAPLVFIHELGHFLAAKMFKIGVPVFSLGFGPRILGFRRAETDYRLSLIPLGGYVRLSGDEADENRTGGPEEFLSRPKWQRFVVFVAGATFNVILAFLAMWLYFGLYGEKEVATGYPIIANVEEGKGAERAGLETGDRVISIGGQDLQEGDLTEVLNLELTLAPNQMRPVVVERDEQRLELQLETGADPKYGWGDAGWSLVRPGADAQAEIVAVIENEPAEHAGLQVGDRVVAAGGHDPISEIQLRLLIRNATDREVPLTVERAGARVELSVTPRLNEETERGFIGVEFKRPPTVGFGVAEAAVESVRANLALSKTLFVVLKRLVSRELPLKSMSGPIGIAQVAQRALDAGPRYFLYLLGFFSLQLGILNLLPIPVLDGGHILILAVEGVMRRELSEAVKERVMQAGFVFLLAFMGVIIVLDVVKSWS